MPGLHFVKSWWKNKRLQPLKQLLRGVKGYSSNPLNPSNSPDPLNPPSPSNPRNLLNPSNPLNPSNLLSPSNLPSPPSPSHPSNPCPHLPNPRFKDSRYDVVSSFFDKTPNRVLIYGGCNDICNKTSTPENIRNDLLEMIEAVAQRYSAK